MIHNINRAMLGQHLSSGAVPKYRCSMYSCTEGSLVTADNSYKSATLLKANFRYVQTNIMKTGFFTDITSKYCKFGNFRENFIFTNSVKRHIFDVKISRLMHDLPISVNDRVISSFSGSFLFTKLRICEISRK